MNLWEEAILSVCHIQNRIPYRKFIWINLRVVFFQGRRKKVCKLVKSLYGLKQALKQWHNNFDHVLVTNGYSINDSDK